MNNKNIVEISESELENVSGGIDKRTKVTLLQGLMLGIVAVAAIPCLAVYKEHYYDGKGECVPVTNDVVSCISYCCCCCCCGCN